MMNTASRFFAAVAIALTITTNAALSQNSIPVTVEQPQSPVTISRMFTAQSPGNNMLWASCVSFTNAVNRQIRAIQFKFTYWDAFDTPISTFRADRVGEFAPGVLIEGPENGEIIGGGNVEQKSRNCWVIGQMVGSLSKVTAEVMKVRYDDGTIWTAPGNHVIYIGTYMTDDTEAHPKTIKCKARFGIVLNLPWDDPRTEQFGCRSQWYHDHARDPQPPLSPQSK